MVEMEVRKCVLLFDVFFFCFFKVLYLIIYFCRDEFKEDEIDSFVQRLFVKQVINWQYCFFVRCGDVFCVVKKCNFVWLCVGLLYGWFSFVMVGYECMVYFCGS